MRVDVTVKLAHLLITLRLLGQELVVGHLLPVQVFDPRVETLCPNHFKVLVANLALAAQIVALLEEARHVALFFITTLCLLGPSSPHSRLRFYLWHEVFRRLEQLVLRKHNVNFRFLALRRGFGIEARASVVRAHDTNLVPVAFGSHLWQRLFGLVERNVHDFD